MIVELEIVNYFSPDIDNIWEWSSDKESSVYYLLELEIARKGEKDGDWFLVEIMNKKAYTDFLVNGRKFNDAKFFLIDNYCWDMVINNLTKFINSCKSPTWKESVEALQEKLIWEYEDYNNESSSKNFH